MTVLPGGLRVSVTRFSDDPLEAIEHCLSLEEVAPPDPARLGPDEVVVAIKSASVNWVDLLMTSGHYQHLPALPYVPGLEYSGVVAAVGQGGQGQPFVEGDRVLVDGLMVGARSRGAYQAQGGFASYAVVTVAAVHRVPENLTLDQASCLLSSYETAYHCLLTRGRVRDGETLLVLGASGLTGMAAVQMGKILGATVIAVGRSPEKLELVRAQGADHVVTCANPDGKSGIRRFRDDVKALTNGRGADVVFDTVGGDLSLESLRCVAFGARFLIVGWASTPFVANSKGQRGAPNANQLPTNLIQMKGLDVLGCPMVISTEKNPALRPPRLAAIMQWVAEGKILPCVSKTYPLADFRTALRARWSGEVAGGCVLHP